PKKPSRARSRSSRTRPASSRSAVKTKKAARPATPAKAAVKKPAPKAAGPERAPAPAPVPNAMGLQVLHLDYTTHNLEEVRRFYTQQLGFTRFQWDPTMNYLTVMTT